MACMSSPIDWYALALDVLMSVPRIVNSFMASPALSSAHGPSFAISVRMPMNSSPLMPS